MARLKEVTVDPKTVVLAKKVDPANVGAPKPAVDLQPGTYKYKAKVSAGGQEIALDLSTSVKEENGKWLATGTMQGPMGSATDTSTMGERNTSPALAQYRAGPGKDQP